MKALLDQVVEYLRKQWDMDQISESVLQNLSSWLQQFRPKDRADALKTIGKLDYISHKNISDFLRKENREILNRYKPEEIVIVPVSEIKNDKIKSGHIMQVLYLMNNTELMDFDYNWNSPFTSKAQKSIYQAAKCFIFLDDFIGTGNTVKKFMDNFYSNYALAETTQTILVCCGIMTKAYKRIEKYFSRIIYLRKYESLFKRTKWGNEDFKTVKKNLRNYELGFDHHGEGDNFLYLFGYGHVEASVYFEHNVPNNNLSILWQKRFNKYVKNDWNPLLIRFFVEKDKQFWYKQIIDGYKAKAEMAYQYRKLRG